MYKEQDKFVRVRRGSPLLPQLIRGFLDAGPQKQGSSLSFVFDGSRLNQKVTADELDIEDGDVIDAFDFDYSSSSLSIVTSRLTLTVINNETNKDVRFALNWSARLNRLMDRYCKFEGLQLDNVAFFHEGRRLTGSKTVAEERLDDGDEIYAYIIG
uniref:Rad60/SUMO-like domain-containing protein n=1 Tax=Chenopodium quinoa TaxID=63459 RepID=A0A803LTV3_CHEQI